MLKKHNYIMKITKNIALKPIKGCIFFDGSYLAEFKGIRVRVIDVHIKGFRPFRLITSLLDKSISAGEIVRHYHKRWDIEISYMMRSKPINVLRYEERLLLFYAVKKLS